MKIVKPAQIYTKFVWAGVALFLILVIGTIGYWFIGGGQDSIIDAFYMTVITITTIGFREVIDITGNPAGQVFTILVALSGIGVLFYSISNFTALAVEGELTDSFRRRRMEKKASNSRGHYIVCDVGSVGSHIVQELFLTERLFVVVDRNKDNVEKALVKFPNMIVVEGDTADNTILLKAGIENARGLFAVTEDDNDNIVISLTAKQLNPSIRVVARCNEVKNEDKMRRAGADAVVSPSFIGGLRIVSEMIRPAAVSFLDIMLRDREKNLRVEEVLVSDSFIGKKISELDLIKHRHFLLLAVRTDNDWVYNPPNDYIIKPKNTFVFLATPEERQTLEQFFGT